MKSSELEDAGVAGIGPRTWHTLRITAIDPAFKVGLDGTELFEAENRTFLEAGKIGRGPSLTASLGLTISRSVLSKLDEASERDERLANRLIYCAHRGRLRRDNTTTAARRRGWHEN